MEVSVDTLSMAEAAATKLAVSVELHLVLTSLQHRLVPQQETVTPELQAPLEHRTPKVTIVPSTQETAARSRLEDFPLPSRAPRTSNVDNESLSQFMREAGRYALLTPEEEIELGVMVQQGAQAREELEALADSVESVRVRELHRHIRRGDQARERFITSNIRLVISWAKKYQNSGIELLDLIQEGTIGLTRAAELFDPNKGFKFSTYASIWIRQALGRAVDRQTRLIRLRNDHEVEIRSVRRAIVRLESAGQVADNQALAEELGCTLDHIENLQEMNNVSRVAHYDAPIRQGETEASLIDFMSDSKSADSDEEIVEQLASRAVITELMEYLTDIERYVVFARDGFDGRGTKTYQQVGEEVPSVIGKKITGEMARRKYIGAIEKMRNHPNFKAIEWS